MKSAMWRRVAVLVVCFVAVSACSGDNGPSPVDAEDVPAVASSSTVDVPVVEGEWQPAASIVLPLPATSDPVGGEPGRPDASQLYSVDGVWLIPGDYNGRPTIWRSENLSEWEVVYHEDRPGVGEMRRHVRFNSVVAWGDRIVASGSGEERSADVERDRAFVLVSEDEGRSFRSVEHPTIADSDRRLDGVVVAGDALIADLLIDRPSASPEPIPHRTLDLATWEPIELPGATDETWAWWTGDGNGLTYALARSWSGEVETTTMWSTRDGVEFARSEIREPLGVVTALPDGVLAMPGRDYGCCGFTEPSLRPGQLWFHDGDGWELTEPDLGQFGDGGGELRSPVTNPLTGRVHAVVARTLRADPAYCYEDLATCQQRELALVASDDGRQWSDVVWPGLSDTRYWLAAANEGELVVWWEERESQNLRFLRWTGPDAPPTFDPSGYEPADSPIPVWNGETVEVGDEYRYLYGLGGCGGMYINDIDWIPDAEIDASGWPVQNVDIADGPSGYAYGRIRLDSADSMSFIIEGQGVVATLSPRTEEPAEICG